MSKKNIITIDREQIMNERGLPYLEVSNKDPYELNKTSQTSQIYIITEEGVGTISFPTN